MEYRCPTLPSSSSMGLPRGYISDDERSRQIKTLRVFNENVSEVHSNAQYRVDFVGKERNPLSLFLVLGPYFPQEPPEIYLSPPPSHHPWTDPKGRVIAAPGLLAYNARHTDLGRLVQAIKRQFQLTPLSVPAPNGMVPSGPLSSPPQAPKTTTNTSSFYQPRAQESILQPPYFPELSQLPLDKLQELDSDPTSLELFFRSESSTTRKAILSRHEEERSSLLSEIERAKGDLGTLSEVLQETSGALMEKKSQIEYLKSELISRTETYVALKKEIGGLPEACDTFRRVSLEKEDESDRLAEQFLDGDFPSSAEDFLKEYFALRNDYHLRKSQSDRLLTQVPKRNNRFPPYH